MQNFLDHIIDFIFPPSKEEVELRGISPINFLKNAKRATPAEFPFISSLFSYKYPLTRELIWQIKYKKNKHAIECAGFALHSELLKQKGELVLIPIPLSKKRYRERGFNQCELIIDEIIRLDVEKQFSKNFDLLIRNKNIDKQTFKNRNERIENTKSIFEVIDGNIDKNTKIIIVDDVTTTGSTILEARKVLIEKGFSEIEALTVAH